MMKIKKAQTSRLCGRLFAVLLLASLLTTLLLFPVSARESDGHFWYVRRNGQNRPGIPTEEARVIGQYHAYYIDQHVTDTEGKRVLYLTFDAGYENGNVEKILDALKAENVHAAFFVLHHLIVSRPDLIERMRTEGHLVCNHTKTHRNMCLLTEEEMCNDLHALEETYRRVCGGELAPYFRFPEGRYNEKTLACAQKLGYKTIFWSFGYEDWDNNRQPDPDASLAKILKNTHNGAVMLFHPTSATNACIMPTLLREWKKMGYTFGTLDELTAE